MCVAPLTIGVQSAVPKSELGIATSAVTFCRSIGAAFGVALMGAALTMHLEGASREEVLGNPAMRDHLAAGLHLGFQLGLGCAVAALLAVGLVPEGSAQDLELTQEAR